MKKTFSLIISLSIIRKTKINKNFLNEQYPTACFSFNFLLLLLIVERSLVLSYPKIHILTLLEWTYSLPPNTTCNLLRALSGITKGQVIGIFSLRIPFKYKEKFLVTCQHVRFVESIQASAPTNSYLEIRCTKGRYSLHVYNRDHPLVKTVCLDTPTAKANGILECFFVRSPFLFGTNLKFNRVCHHPILFHSSHLRRGCTETGGLAVTTRRVTQQIF